ncbi:glycoside hydrolase family 113 [Novispirillum sp. DQ9]|uniref:glycoside hydrolase family 113 n=1 Tax=Novispirillum sp. DQ9 TaxID=3398612 RepID=UPI003C7ACB21
MPQFQIQGYNYPSYWNTYYGEPASRESLSDLAETGAGWVSLVPNWYTRDLTGSVVRRTEATESDAHVIAAIRQAHQAGLNVILKPHVDPESGDFRGLFRPRDVERWFSTYRAMIVNYARIAEREGVQAMSIGCELDSLDGARYARQWTRIINDVRAVFSGDLTYASLDSGIEESPFWGQVDTIGVDAYVELTNGTMPTLARAIEAWFVPATWWEAAKHGEGGAIAHYRALSEHYDKPILITETGWRNRDGAGADPGDWATESPRDDAEQALGYQAFFRAWSGNTGGADPWMRGAMFWNWDPFDPATNPYALPVDYTPQGKPALDVVSRWLRSGNQGRWAFQGGDGNDGLRGGRRDEVLVGYRGNDVLVGGAGHDLLNGGRGRDTMNGGAGRDMASYLGVEEVTVDLGRVGWQNTGAGGWDRLVGIEDLAGGLLADHLAGDDRANRLYGNEGSDTLTGRGGRDTLYGEGGNDTLTGGAGADIFVLDNPGGGRDVILDFQSGVDRLALSGLQYGLRPGMLNGQRLAFGTAAPRPGTRLVYDTASGRLSYDADGSGSGAAVAIAVLKGAPTVRASDLLILKG